MEKLIVHPQQHAMIDHTYGFADKLALHPSSDSMSIIWHECQRLLMMPDIEDQMNADMDCSDKRLYRTEVMQTVYKFVYCDETITQHCMATPALVAIFQKARGQTDCSINVIIADMCAQHPTRLTGVLVAALCCFVNEMVSLPQIELSVQHLLNEIGERLTALISSVAKCDRLMIRCIMQKALEVTMSVGLHSNKSATESIHTAHVTNERHHLLLALVKLVPEMNAADAKRLHFILGSITEHMSVDNKLYGNMCTLSAFVSSRAKR